MNDISPSQMQEAARKETATGILEYLEREGGFPFSSAQRFLNGQIVRVARSETVPAHPPEFARIARGLKKISTGDTTPLSGEDVSNLATYGDALHHIALSHAHDKKKQPGWEEYAYTEGPGIIATVCAAGVALAETTVPVAGRQEGSNSAALEDADRMHEAANALKPLQRDNLLGTEHNSALDGLMESSPQFALVVNGLRGIVAAGGNAQLPASLLENLAVYAQRLEDRARRAENNNHHGMDIRQKRVLTTGPRIIDKLLEACMENGLTAPPEPEKKKGRER